MGDTRGGAGLVGGCPRGVLRPIHCGKLKHELMLNLNVSQKPPKQYIRIIPSRKIPSF